MKAYQCRTCPYVALDEDNQFTCHQYGTSIENIRNCPDIPDTTFFFDKKEKDEKSTVWDLGKEQTLTVKQQKDLKYALIHQNGSKTLSKLHFQTDKQLLHHLTRFVDELRRQNLFVNQKRLNYFLYGKIKKSNY